MSPTSASVRAPWPAAGNDGAVKRATALGHLVEMAEVGTERARLRDTDIGWPLEEMWVTGDLLGVTDTLKAGTVVLVLDLPADEMPWLALHRAGEWVSDQLRLGKRPLQWCYRPLTGRSGTTSTADWFGSGRQPAAKTRR